MIFCVIGLVVAGLTLLVPDAFARIVFWVIFAGIPLLFGIGKLVSALMASDDKVLFFQKGNEPRKGTGYFEGVPDLIAEVLSPGTYNRDRKTKLKAYEEAGAPEYWLLDPDRQTVEVYVLKKGKGYVELVRGGPGDEVWSSALPGFRVKVADLFLS